MKGFGHKARKALKRHATAVWRANQPPLFAITPHGHDKVTLHVGIEHGPQGLGIYAAGILREQHPREYGFVLTDDAGGSCFLPVEMREYATPAQPSAQPSAQHLPPSLPTARTLDVADKALAEIRAKIGAGDNKKRACA